MADENHGGGNIPETVTFIVGLLIILFALWWVRGGPGQAGGLRGIFLNSPPPLGNGQPYGPAVGTTTPSTSQ